LIGDIAWQVSKEGREVRYSIKDQREANIADGFVAKSENPEKSSRKPASTSFLTGSSIPSTKRWST
jgi:hypothetical protein